MLIVCAISQVNIYKKDDCSKASLYKILDDGSSCADVSSAKAVELDCPPGAGVDATPQGSLTQDPPLTMSQTSGSSAITSSKTPRILSQNLLVTSLPSSAPTSFAISTSSQAPPTSSQLTSLPETTASSALQAKNTTASAHNLSVTGEIIVGTVIPALAIVVAIIIGIDQRRRMRRGQGNVVNVFLDGTRRSSRQRPSPLGNSRRTWPGN